MLKKLMRTNRQRRGLTVVRSRRHGFGFGIRQGQIHPEIPTNGKHSTGSHRAVTTTAMAQLIRSAKASSDWTDAELLAYNISITPTSQLFFSNPVQTRRSTILIPPHLT
jgi:hypothetical protein